MEQTEQKSGRNVLLIVGIIAALVIVAGLAIYALVVTGTKNEKSATTASSSPWPRVANKEQVKENLTDLNKSLKQAAADQAAAKAALKDSENQVKVGN